MTTKTETTKEGLGMGAEKGRDKYTCPKCEYHHEKWPFHSHCEKCFYQMNLTFNTHGHALSFDLESDEIGGEGYHDDF